MQCYRAYDDVQDSSRSKVWYNVDRARSWLPIQLSGKWQNTHNILWCHRLYSGFKANSIPFFKLWTRKRQMFIMFKSLTDYQKEANVHYIFKSIWRITRKRKMFIIYLKVFDGLPERGKCSLCLSLWRITRKWQMYQIWFSFFLVQTRIKFIVKL